MGAMARVGAGFGSVRDIWRRPATLAAISMGLFGSAEAAALEPLEPAPFPQGEQYELVDPMGVDTAGSTSAASTTTTQAIPKFLTAVKRQQAKHEESTSGVGYQSVVPVSGDSPCEPRCRI